jgi:cation diffusion facilitator CzcD-associated flavoprotein CzcO
VIKPDFQVGIIGAGFSGIVAALRLQRSNRNSFVIFERAGAIGGTWRDNTYPGCACDVPSNLYSISFAPKPDWTRGYGTQAEILEYMHELVKNHHLESHLRLNTEIVEYEFLESEGLWKLTDQRGQSVLVRSVIISLAPFSRPSMPSIPGLESFQGAMLHSARWDHGVTLEGKRVAVVGTGASAVQIVPAIAKQVSSLTVFQRTAAWVADRMDAEVPLTKRELFKAQPWRQKLERNLLYWFLEARGRMFTGNKWLHQYSRDLSLKKLEREIQDPELRRKLTPTYEIGCKRILSSDDYLPTFNQAHVKLETTSIAEITPKGIRTQSGTEHEFDVIICATGFEVAEITTGPKITGLQGRDLLAHWREHGIEAFKGSSVAGFPNLNFMLGPNTGLGHSSMIGIMEAQMNYIMAYLELLERNGDGAYLDLKLEVQRAFNIGLQSQFTSTVWASGCKSWYANSSGKITTLYPRLVQNFRDRTKHIDPLDYTVLNNAMGRG